jgi:hypothetical protein
MRKINANFSTAIWRSLKGIKGRRKWVSLVGYSAAQLKAHIEAQFWPGMSWSNWGLSKKGQRTWQIDHIAPRASFLFTSAEDPQFRECWALSNLQPLWWPDNISKSNKLGYTVERP